VSACRHGIKVRGRAVACHGAQVILHGGQHLVYSGGPPGGGQWGVVGTLPFGPTPAQSISIGQLKAKYATPGKQP
jgi:glycine cleavage system aminomethyltransferase T